MGILNKQHFLTTEYYIGIEKNKVHTNIVVEQKYSWYSFEWSELVREPYNPTSKSQEFAYAEVDEERSGIIYVKLWRKGDENEK